MLFAQSLTGFLWVLYEKNQVRDIWSSLAYELVMLTCNDSLTEGTPDVQVSGRATYIQLWRNIFEKTCIKLLPDLEDSETSEEYDERITALTLRFHETLYDEVMNVILRIPHQFNLKLHRIPDELDDVVIPVDEATANEQQFNASDITHLVAINPQDYSALVAFVDFTEAFLTSIQVKLFEKWVCNAGEAWISMSRRHPLISGFHRLFGLCLRLVNKLNYFHNLLKPGLEGQPHNGTEEELVDEAGLSQRICYAAFTRHIHNLLLDTQLYKDELLASCLQAILHAPRELTSVSSFLNPLRTALRFGLNFHPLANLAIDVLEIWIDTMPSDVVKAVLPDLLPALHDYLTAPTTEVEIQETRTPATKLGKSQYGTKHQRKKWTARFVSEADADSAAVFRALQLRVVRVLGKTGRDAVLVLGNRVDTYKKALRWESVPKLIFDLPYQDVKLPIICDDLLSRIVELAEVASDRKTKMASCELIHSLVTFLIGKTNLVGDKTKGTYFVLWSKIFPIMLVLSVDVDRAVRELIRPLSLQITRWITRFKTNECPEAEAVLSACFDGSASPDGQRRDFATTALVVFFEWSIKHTRENQEVLNAQPFFARMYDFLRDSNMAKRIGSAVLFNKIYRHFQRESSLVDRYTLELLYYFLQTLRLMDTEASSRPILESIGYLRKIILLNYELLRCGNDTRNPVPSLETTDLQSMVGWLFKQAGSQEIVFAHNCLELYLSLVRNIAKGPKEWLERMQKSNANYLLEIFEPPSIHMPEQQRDWTPWSRQIIATLNGYTFLQVHSILTPIEILQQPGTAFVKSLLDFMTHASKPSRNPAQYEILRATGIVSLFTFIEMVCNNASETVLGLVDLVL
ncbi:hypothetical protein SeLEV6574_g08358, partial [Synchytrium endobioticum]